MKRGRPRKERYARLMGGFWRNPKIRRLSLEARGVLLMAWSYAADQATDGLVPVDLLQAWAGKRYAKIIGELTRGTDNDGDRPLLTVGAEGIVSVNGWASYEVTDEDADTEERHRRWRERARAARLRATIVARDGGACAYCGAPVDLRSARIDHVVPVAQGGGSSAHNLVTACSPCNLSKGARTPKEWLS